MTWSTSRSNGTIPVCSSHRPNTRARWTSHAARYCRAPPRLYSCSNLWVPKILAVEGEGQVTQAPLREERKVVTALFADVVGSTPLGERLDAEEVRLVVGDAVA